MRVYQGDSVIPDDPRPHTIVEVERDNFLEIDLPRFETLDKGLQHRLRAFTRKLHSEEKTTNEYHIRMARRYFQTIYAVPNLRFIGEF